MMPFIKLLRPPDWIKNTFVFAALIFGDRVRDADALLASVLAFIAFCLASSAGYIFNDIRDRDRDRLHPIKKNRPIPSGQVSVPTARVIMVALLVMAGAVSALLPMYFWLTIAAYLVLTVSYSLFLKHQMLLDVIVIAILFVVRAIAGAEAINVDVSPWLLVCTFMLCLFLGFGKRRCEIAAINNVHAIRGHRPTLVRYTPDLLNQLLSTSGGIAIITFLLYTLDTTRPSPFEHNRQNLIYTLPFVVYGIYRYAMLVELGKGSGPTDLILGDRAFLASVLLWGLAAIVALYLVPGLGS